MSYSDTVKQIKNSRASRDEARDDLYKLQLKYLALSKEQKKFERKEIISDKDILQKTEEIRKIISELNEKISGINSQLNNLNSIKKLLSEKQTLLNQLTESIAKAMERLREIDIELKDDTIGKERRADLENEKENLLRQVKALEKKTGELRKEIQHLNDKLQNSPSEDSLQEEKKQLESRVNSLAKELEVLIKRNTKTAPDNSGELEKLKDEIQKQKNLTKDKNKSILSLVEKLFGQSTPLQLIEEWNDMTPILLFPLRVETKFKIINEVKELWVRVFPDDIAVVTHEKVLTQTEINFGKAHWKALWTAKSDEKKKQAAWKILTDKFGLNRSAWVALQTKPTNWDTSGNLESENELQFPIFDLTKPSSWTQAPHTRIMPDRFVLLPFREGKSHTPIIGKQVTDILVIGPAPIDDLETPSLTRNETDNSINFGEDFIWVKDFDKAVDAGMGFKISLDNESAAKGFDQLLVIGLKLSCDEGEGKILLEDLFENHRYSIEGLSLVQQGAPTNNTEEEDAAYSKTQTIDDIRKQIENNQVLFSPVSDLREATDGQRLADYLGINYETFQSVNNSNLKDRLEAVAMNKALYSATLGYYMHSMLNEVVNDNDLIRLRSHFTNHVTGRGPLAAIRVGNQPYGILITSAMEKWKYARSIINSNTDFNFYTRLHGFLSFLESEWKKSVPGLSHISKLGNAGDTLMKVLGLHPNSVEMFQRVGYSFDYLKDLQAFGWRGKYFGDVYKMVLEKSYVKQILRNFGYNQTHEDGTPKPVPLLLQLIFQHYHTQLDNKNLIDGQMLSEDKPIKPFDELNDLNYIDWLIANAPDEKKLEAQDFGESSKPNSLLYMMLLNSMLLEASQSIQKYLNKNNIIANELVRSRKFMNMSSAPSVSHWEVFQAPVNKIIPTEVSTMSLHKFIYSHSLIPGESDLVDNLKEHMWALEKLKDMPTARLERALVEHIDTLSYRLDCWETSLFDCRLQEQRNIISDNASRRNGIYLGSYGYLENVKPGINKRVKISEDILPQELKENKDNLFKETNNGGYVQTPTLNHATAAALLRNGYLTHSSPSDNNMLSVNLSSERVRRAGYLIEGIRNGQTLEALLGYQFERGLHDWTTRPSNPIILNHLIPNFRQAFPIKKTKVPQEGKTTGPEEITEEFTVVNGLAFAGVTKAFPYDITTLPSLSTDQINAIKKEKENLENTLDALRDVLTSESSYQLALGNFDRAAAIMQSMSSGTIPPGIEVINSGRGTDMVFTNKVVIHFDTAVTSNPWTSIALTQKAITEPGLNQWLGTILGDPFKTRCWVTAIDKDGNVLTRPDLTNIEESISIEDLKLQPIDFIYLIGNKLEETGTSELETRIRYVFAKKNFLSDDTIVKIEFARTDTPADLTVKSFAEMLPFVNYIRNIVSGSRPLLAKDFQPASKEIVVSDDNPNNIDTAQLQVRVENVFAFLNNLVNQLKIATDDAKIIKTEPLVNSLRDKLKEIADAGYVYAFPQSALGFEQQQIDVLVAQGISVAERFEELKEGYSVLLAKVNSADTKADQKLSLLTEMIKSLLGDDFVILPQFSFNNTADIDQAYNTRAQLLKYSKDTLEIPFSVKEWLHGISLVRTKMHNWELIRLLNDNFNDTLFLEGEPLQLPYRASDSWLAVEFPTGTEIEHDTLSFVQYNPQGFDAYKTQCGLLIDEWTEVIPNKEEVTGITFNYNQPNSVPPQAILLAVTPEEMGKWKWENLVSTILDTFDRAKRRAIEPDIIDSYDGVSTLLPATLAEFNTSKSGLSLDYSLNIAFVLTQSMALSAKV